MAKEHQREILTESRYELSDLETSPTFYLIACGFAWLLWSALITLLKSPALDRIRSRPPASALIGDKILAETAFGSDVALATEDGSLVTPN